MTIHPSILTCIKFSVKTFGPVFLLLLAFSLVVDLVESRQFMGALLHNPLESLGVFGGLPLAAAFVFYIILRACAWTIEPDGLRGRSYWGRRELIAWSDVDKVVYVAAEGLPVLQVTSASSKKKIFAYVLDINSAEIHAQLRRHAGPDHVLTQCFRPQTA